LRDEWIVTGLKIAIQFIQPCIGAGRDLDPEPPGKFFARFRYRLNRQTDVVQTLRAIPLLRGRSRLQGIRQ